MPTCSDIRMSKLEAEVNNGNKKDVLLLDFPQNPGGVQWKNVQPPRQKGIYTWTSAPKNYGVAQNTNRKLVRENHNLQR